MVIEERNFYKKEIIMPDWLKATLACGLVCLFIPPLLGLFIGAGIVFIVFVGLCHLTSALGIPTKFLDD